MKKRILNMGCKEDTYGTDFIDLYPTRNEIKQIDLNRDNLPYEDNTFDEVVCLDLITHLVNVGNIIKEINRVLKIGGKLKLSGDNSNYWASGYENSLNRWGRINLKGSESYKCYQNFTDAHLSNYLIYYGFKVIRLEYVFTNEVSVSFFRKWFKRFVNKLLLFTPFDKLSYKIVEIEGVKIK